MKKFVAALIFATSSVCFATYAPIADAQAQEEREVFNCRTQSNEGDVYAAEGESIELTADLAVMNCIAKKSPAECEKYSFCAEINPQIQKRFVCSISIDSQLFGGSGEHQSSAAEAARWECLSMKPFAKCAVVHPRCVLLTGGSKP